MRQQSSVPPPHAHAHPSKTMVTDRSNYYNDIDINMINASANDDGNVEMLSLLTSSLRRSNSLSSLFAARRSNDTSNTRSTNNNNHERPPFSSTRTDFSFSNNNSMNSISRIAHMTSSSIQETMIAGPLPLITQTIWKLLTTSILLICNRITKMPLQRTIRCLLHCRETYTCPQPLSLHHACLPGSE